VKDHEIARLVNALTIGLLKRFPMLPQRLRGTIRDIVVKNLNKQNLRKDL